MERLAQFIKDRAAETYPELPSSGHSKITEEAAREVVKYLPKEATILDVGCGQGPALRWFKENGFVATGITTNDEDYRACEEQGFSVSKRDMHETQKLDGFFDCVWARHVLEHSVAPMFALWEMARVLRIGGILYAEVPSPDTACQHHTNPNHYSVMGHNMWMELIKRTGFEIMEARAINLITEAGADCYFSYICRKQ